MFLAIEISLRIVSSDIRDFCDELPLKVSEKLEGQTGSFEATLSVSPYPFVPQLGEVIKYSYSFPSDARIKLRVFDTAGRLIATLYDE